jgi:hypothetical protein
LIEHDSNNFEFISTCHCFKLFIINVVSGVIAVHQIMYAHFDIASSRPNVRLYVGSIFSNICRYYQPSDFLMIVCVSALEKSVMSNIIP